MVASFAWITSFGLMALAVFVAGATLASISPLSLALQGVVVEPTDYSRANALYNAFYAAGMLLGPPLSSVIFDARGGAFMLAHLAALWVGFVLFATAFLRDDPGTRPEDPSFPWWPPSRTWALGDPWTHTVPLAKRPRLPKT
jgi:MFS family permease